eukprot:Opistho-2@85277
MKVKNIFKIGKGGNDKRGLASSTSTSSASFIGKTLRVGDHNVVIEKSVAEGGFAYVFEARDVSSGAIFALKRVVVDDEKLPLIEKEIAFLKRVNGHKNIVALKDSSVSKIRDGYFEGLILMELCPGRVLDIMAERVNKPLTEAEILHVFTDVCEGVAHVHTVSPPIVHRDLKIENILRGSDGIFKLCDFGSATDAIVRPQGTAGIAAIEEDIQRHTTVQYRAPEMIDLYSGKLIGLKADIWALGCLLYKLCFMTTPFEDRTLQILNCKYTVPTTPAYSPALLSLIKFMLEIDPVQRPDIFTVANRAALLRHGNAQHSLTPPPAYLEVIAREGNSNSGSRTEAGGSPLPQSSPHSQQSQQQQQQLYQQQQQQQQQQHTTGSTLGVANTHGQTPRSPMVSRVASPLPDRSQPAAGATSRRERPKGSLPSAVPAQHQSGAFFDVATPASPGVGNPGADARDSFPT